jgi:hypothetical protein
MLYGLGPGELILCLVPLFVLIFIIGAILFVTDRRARKTDEEDD